MAQALHMDWDTVWERARIGGGALGAHDAVALGTNWDALSAHARRHGWTRLHRGAVLLPGTRRDDIAEEASAVAAAGPDSSVGRLAAVHRAGARDRRPDCIDLWVPRAARAPAVRRLEAGLRPVVARRTSTLRGCDVVVGEDGVRRTTVARALADLAASLKEGALRLLLIDAVQRRLVTLEEVVAVLDVLPRAHGRALLLRLCDELRQERSDSALELITREHLRRRGLTPHAAPFPWRCPDGVIVHIDIGFPEAWVAVECDGLASRLDRRRLALHHRRLEQIGRNWSLLLVDWTRITSDSQGFLREVAARLAEADPAREPALAA